MSRLLVFNLPKTVTKNDLWETFSRKGNVTNVQLVFTVDRDYCYFAMIAFETEEESKAAHSYFNNVCLYSSRIIVERCSELDSLQKSESNEINYHETINNSNDRPKETQCNKIKRNETNKNTASICYELSYLANLPYDDGQWSVSNPNGRKKYSKLFLLQLANEVVCQKKHDTLKNWSHITNKLFNLPHKTSQSPKNNHEKMHGNEIIHNKAIKNTPSICLPRYLAYLPYEEGQWSVSHPNGRKKYSKLFLLQLANEVVSKNKHNALMNWSHITKTLSNSSQTSQHIPDPDKICLSKTSSRIMNEEYEKEKSKLKKNISNMNKLCANIIQIYELTQNLNDITYLLPVDKSISSNKHKEFVKSMCLLAMKSNKLSDAGQLLAELLAKRVFSLKVITEGIDRILKDWLSLYCDCPDIFLYVATIIRPLHTELKATLHPQ